jgi:serine/threonine-protein kinase
MTGRDLAGRRLGGFELVEPLGTGAFATVWRARQLRLGRDVAVKVLDPVVARNPESARRFEREGRSAASLDHPNIVPVYEAGEDDGLVFLAMRLVDGETLEGLLERDGPIGVDRTVDVLASVADALDHAHSRELTHRDVKPSNILLGDERVWLADFGIAATAQEIGRYTMGSIGTAEYMAPEQAAGGDLDHRADLYALGCVVFHCLTGSPPFTGDELMPVLMAHVNDPVPTVDDPPLAAFFERALAKDPADRYQSGRELIDALRAAGGDGGARPTIVASAEPARPAWPYAAVGAVLALVIGAVGFFVFAGGGGDPDEADVANVEQVPTTTPVAGVTTPASAPPSTAAGDDADDSDDDATDESSGVTTAPPNTDAPAPVVPDGLAIVSTNDSLASLNPHTNFGVSGILTSCIRRWSRSNPTSHSVPTWPSTYPNW